MKAWFKISANHFLLLKNWLSIRENLFFSGLLIFIFWFLGLVLKQNLLNSETSLIKEIVKSILALAIPISLTNLYLNSTQKEINFFENFLSKTEIKNLRILQTFILNFVLWVLLSGIGFRGAFDGVSQTLIFSVQSILLTFFSFFQVFKIKKNKVKNQIFTQKSLLKVQDKNLPPKSVFEREILFLWRFHKAKVLQIFFGFLALNGLILLINSNTDLGNLLFFGILIQFLIFIDLPLNFGLENDTWLLQKNPKLTKEILKGEFAFWSLVFILLWVLVCAVFGIFVESFGLVFLPFGISVGLVLIGFAVVLRIAFAESKVLRNLTFGFSVLIPFSIPIVTFFAYRRLK
ncbi:MAG: hypothetical protein DWQ06_03885 [Calditrichaeota bacterium]|nr:MAG: hypothetical protein DWQ06_03885 [Calditrichota bacterium]